MADIRMEVDNSGRGWAIHVEWVTHPRTAPSPADLCTTAKFANTTISNASLQTKSAQQSGGAGGSGIQRRPTFPSGIGRCMLLTRQGASAAVAVLRPMTVPRKASGHDTNRKIASIVI